ncbi:DUF1476 domain-containing protein [Aestuariivirga litoralis]|uniref:DUF1476 domain-containing protein n=1 Tax=Aestuariivirga litoralis TaxID=2650924 RepID=UPI0018C52E2C|nr:DUF1476 domain-containing protein [Aestuariivirga litoralis]MBG1231253.1 DUF1476 domain-containing protein [Aestuariivirga litoralis]
MTTFDKREMAEEGKFAHDAEKLFKIRARRAKLVGQWAAGKLGYAGDEADAYAKSLILADLEEDGDADVVRKLKADFAAKKIDVSDHQIERTLAEKLIEAEKQLQAGA